MPPSAATTTRSGFQLGLESGSSFIERYRSPGCGENRLVFYVEIEAIRGHIHRQPRPWKEISVEADHALAHERRVLARGHRRPSSARTGPSRGVVKIRRLAGDRNPPKHMRASGGGGRERT